MFAATTLAGALIELGRPEEAIVYAEYALSVAARINSSTGRARGKQILERVEAATGQTDGQ
jgi:hypothetical protein